MVLDKLEILERYLTKANDSLKALKAENASLKTKNNQLEALLAEQDKEIKEANSQVESMRSNQQAAADRIEKLLKNLEIAAPDKE